jgi:hypothetical protein
MAVGVDAIYLLPSQKVLSGKPWPAVFHLSLDT